MKISHHQRYLIEGLHGILVELEALEVDLFFTYSIVLLHAPACVYHTQQLLALLETVPHLIEG